MNPKEHMVVNTEVKISTLEQMRGIVTAFKQAEKAYADQQPILLTVKDRGTDGSALLARWMLDLASKQLTVENPEGVRETVIASHGLLFYRKLLQRVGLSGNELWNGLIKNGIAVVAKEEALALHPDVTRVEVSLDLKPEMAHVGAAHSQGKVYQESFLHEFAVFLAEQYGNDGQNDEPKVPFPAVFLLLQINGKGNLPIAEAPTKNQMRFGVGRREEIDTEGARPLVAQRLRPGFKPSAEVVEG